MSGKHGMLWRAAPMADPLVSEWHSRDLDSRVTERETRAVADWRENTTAVIHAMRDNPMHFAKIMGGMFGMRLQRIRIRRKMERIYRGILGDPKSDVKGRTWTDFHKTFCSVLVAARQACGVPDFGGQRESGLYPVPYQQFLRR